MRLAKWLLMGLAASNPASGIFLERSNHQQALTNHAWLKLGGDCTTPARASDECKDDIAGTNCCYGVLKCCSDTEFDEQKAADGGGEEDGDELDELDLSEQDAPDDLGADLPDDMKESDTTAMFTPRFVKGTLNPAPTVTEINIIYMRHGQSAGNAKQFWRAGDGVLTSKGKKQALDRVAQLSTAQQMEILDVDLVMVSPSCRAMQTAIATLMEAYNLATTAGQAPTMPTVEINANLREKTKSASDRPGDSLWHTKETCIDEAFKWFDGTTAHTAAQATMRAAILASYQVGEDTGNAIDFANQIKAFKGDLEGKEVANIFIVAHSGLGRYMMGHLFPVLSAQSEDVMLQQGGRNIMPLQNCGVIKVLFLKEGRIFTKRDKSTGTLDGSGGWTNLANVAKKPMFETKSKKQSECPLFFPLGHEQQGFLSAGFNGGFFMVEKPGTTGTDSRLIMVFRNSDGTKMQMTWMDKWGKTKGTMNIVGATVATADKDGKKEVTITPASGKAQKYIMGATEATTLEGYVTGPTVL